MRRNALKFLLAALTVAAPLVAVSCGTTYSSTPPEYPTGDLEGSRYETMRVLADRLVERLDGLRDELRVTRNTQAETPVFSDLLEKARRFRDRMQDYSNPYRYVRNDVEELDRLARDYDDRTRNVSASSRAVQLWQGAQDVIDRMRRLLAGENVDVPPRGTESSPYPTYPTTPTYPTGPSGSYGSVLSGSALDDFRRTAHEIVVRAMLARDTAERAGGAYNDSARRVLADMSYFVSGARDLESRASGSSVDRRDVRTYVDRLLEDARRIDRTMRDTSAYSGAWTDWAEVMRLLQRLSDIAR
ncbi:MAG TPA: hypothetical protein VGS98_10630 [Thermoanaerobaculia bacterium]|jgi:hypothetical protein|nr:hypothetical protein [Thermoanaerobaculia bacterium]